MSFPIDFIIFFPTESHLTLKSRLLFWLKYNGAVKYMIYFDVHGYNMAGLWLFYLEMYIQLSSNIHSLCKIENTHTHRGCARSCSGSHSIKETYLVLLLLD